MELTPYATHDDYTRMFPDEPITDATLQRATAGIDAMTFGRIRRSGFTTLTTFQQGIIRQATCEQAHFETQYGELLDSPLASYGIGGVSMSFRDGATSKFCGVDTTDHVHALLVQSGLAWRGL